MDHSRQGQNTGTNAERLSIPARPCSYLLVSPLILISRPTDSEIMDSPPYTPGSAEESAPDNIWKAQRLYQFLLENIAFAYGVSQEALLEALASEHRLYLPLSGKVRPVIISPTTEQERKEYLPLCKLIRASRRHVRLGQYSLNTESDYHILYQQLVLPCQALELCPSYVGSWIADYNDHQFDPTKRLATYLYDDCARIRIFGHTLPFPVVWYSAILQTKLTADDVFVEDFPPNERTQLLLGSAIARFGGKHFRYRRLRPQRRILHSKLGMEELLRLVLRYDDARHGVGWLR